MNKMGVNQGKRLTVWEYSQVGISDAKIAAEWIFKAKNIPFFEAEHISLRDLDARSDEGNTSLQLATDVSTDKICEEIKARYIDVASVIGYYKGHLADLGVDFRSKTVYITLKNKSASLITEIEDALRLMD